MGITVGIIKRCLEECEQSTYRFKIGAVVFSGKRIISSGHNGIRSSSIHKKYKVYENSLHAEQSALLGADWRKLKNCSILVMKCSKTTKQISNAKPCIFCMSMLKHIGIKDIYYSNEHGEIIKLQEDICN